MSLSFRFITTALSILSALGTTKGIICYDCDFDHTGTDELMNNERCKENPPPKKYMTACDPDFPACWNSTVVSNGTILSINRGCADSLKVYGCTSAMQTNGNNAETCSCNTDICNGNSDPRDINTIKNSNVMVSKISLSLWMFCLILHKSFRGSWI